MRTIDPSDPAFAPLAAPIRHTLPEPLPLPREVAPGVFEGADGRMYTQGRPEPLTLWAYCRGRA